MPLDLNKWKKPHDIKNQVALGKTPGAPPQPGAPPAAPAKKKSLGCVADEHSDTLHEGSSPHEHATAAKLHQAAAADHAAKAQKHLEHAKRGKMPPAAMPAPNATGPVTPDTPPKPRGHGSWRGGAAARPAFGG